MEPHSETSTCRPTQRRLQTAPVVMFVAWGACLTILFYGLWSYSQTKGMGSPPPLAQVARIDVSQSGFTLVMAVHPKCPCTRSTVYELERLLARCNGLLRAEVYVYRPEGEDEAWAGSDPLGLARVPHVAVHSDAGGAQAAQLGCLTSGATVLYDKLGTPVFWGGITAGRGHAGDNLGSDSIHAIVVGRTPPESTTPVYGCPLVDNECAGPVCSEVPAP